jgi:hypothetical protein
MDSVPKRPRGGQIGNQNALKHGFYSAAFKGQDRLDLKSAEQVAGLNEEIALLRAQLKSVAQCKPRNSRLVTHIISTLARIMRTNEKLHVTRSQEMDVARLHVLADYFGNQDSHTLLGDLLEIQERRKKAQNPDPPVET